MTTDMAHARLTDGIKVIFDQDSRSSFQDTQSQSSIAGRSRSRSSGRSSGSGGRTRSTRRAHRRHRHRSSSSSSGSISRADRPRSRSHPRCHRPADRCRCDDHYRSSRRHAGHRRSPPRHNRARSRSYSPSQEDRSTRRSGSQKRKHNRRVVEVKISSSSASRNNRSRSRSSGRSVSLSVDAKRELLRTAAANAVKILGVEKVELPESVKPILEEQDSRSSSPILEEQDSRSSSPEPEERVRPEPVHERSQSQSSDESDEDDASPRLSLKRSIISFSIHNSVAKPTVAPNCPKTTSRMDIVDVGSRKPYGGWVQVRTTGKISLSHKRPLTTSR